MAAFPRWREAPSDGARRAWEGLCGLHPDEALALRVLGANLAACGGVLTTSDEIGCKLRPGVAAKLCAGLEIGEAQIVELVRVCPVKEGWPARMLERGLREHLALPEPVRKPPEKAEPSTFAADRTRFTARGEDTPKWSRDALKAREGKEQPMETATSNGHHSKAAALTPLARRIAAEVDRRKIDLEGVVTDSVKSQLAGTVGATRGSVSGALAAIRKERGIPSPGSEKAEVQPTCEQCGKPRHPNSAQVCRACYEAAGSAPAVVEVQPAAVLNEPVVTEREPLTLEAASLLSMPEVPVEGPEGQAYDAYDLLQEVAKAHRERDELRRERDETARMLAEVQDERDRLKASRGSDPILATLRAQVERLKADCKAWEARADEARRERDAARALANEKLATLPSAALDPEAFATNAALRQWALDLAAGDFRSAEIMNDGISLQERLETFRLAAQILEVALR